MYVNSFMYDLTLNDKGELAVLIEIPKDMQGEVIENVEIRISKMDIDRMNRVFKLAPNECDDCGNPWKLGDPTREVEESRIKTLCTKCFHS